VVLDTQEQREMLLEIIENLQFRGSDIDKMYHLKQAVLNAEIKKNDG